MPKKKYLVTLTDEERVSLEALVKKGKNPAYKVNHARILLLADTNQEKGGWKDQDNCEALKISVATIERVRQRLVEQGLEAALNRKQQQNRKPCRLDGEQEAHLIALTCSSPPEVTVHTPPCSHQLSSRNQRWINPLFGSRNDLGNESPRIKISQATGFNDAQQGTVS